MDVSSPPTAVLWSLGALDKVHVTTSRPVAHLICAARSGAREIWVLDRGVYSIEDVIKAVQEGSELGKLFIRIEQLHMADLKEKVESGHYVIENWRPPARPVGLIKAGVHPRVAE